MSLQWFGERAKHSIHEGAVEGLTDAAKRLYDKSQELVPVSPLAGGGYLKGSARMAVDASALEAAVGYDTGETHAQGRKGGGNLAVVVHEDLTAQHAAGKTAKFLENPLNAGHDEFLRTMSIPLKRKLT